MNNWVTKFGDSKTPDTVRKVKKSVDDFLKSLDLYDIQLEDITKRQVNDHIELHAKTTVQGKISRLRSIRNYSESLGKVSSPSPFEKNIYATGDAVNKKQPFTSEEMTWIKANVATSEPTKRLLVELGVFTGCCISELCNVKARDVLTDGDITALYIEKGKTDAAPVLSP